MSRRVPAVVLQLMMLVMLTAAMTAQVKSTNPLVGVWKRLEMVAADGTRRDLVAPNFYIFTAKHYSIVRVQDDVGPRPPFKSLAQPTDAERIAAWTPFTANAGTYEVSGSTLTIHRIVDKTPNVMGSSITFNFRVEGNTLALVQSSVGGQPAQDPPTLRLSRVE